MPLRFRCGHCNRLLGIGRRKAGQETVCPHCRAVILVPAGAVPGDRGEMDDIDDLVNPAGVASASTLGAIAAPVMSPAGRNQPPLIPNPRPAHAPEPLPDDERPLFERDLDAVLGVHRGTDDTTANGRPKPSPTTGMDALSLGPDPGQFVINSQIATVLAIATVLLLALSFAAGFLVGSGR